MLDALASVSGDRSMTLFRRLSLAHLPGLLDVGDALLKGKRDISELHGWAVRSHVLEVLRVLSPEALGKNSVGNYRMYGMRVSSMNRTTLRAHGADVLADEDDVDPANPRA